jgi:hypothetical protein
METTNSGDNNPQVPSPLQPNEGSFKKLDYYTSSGKKVGDFFIGFLGIWAINFVFGSLLSLSSSFFSEIYSSFSFFGISAWFIGLAVDIVLVILAFKYGRRFIAIGILATFLIPLLILGACFLVFLGSSGMPFGVN